LRFAPKVTLPLPPPIKGGGTKPSPLVGQAFQTAGGLERPPHKEGRERGIATSSKGAHLNAAFYSSALPLGETA